MEEIKKVNEDIEFIEYMSAEEDARKIQNSLKKQWKEEALIEGKQEGIKEGIKEGIQQGIEQGIKEGSKQEKIAIAKNMLNESIDISLISKMTHLSEEEINILKADG